MGRHGHRPACPHDERRGGDMDTVRLTTAQAIVRYLVAQRTVVDGREAPLFPGVFAIFGHGNVTALGNALDEARDELPVHGAARTSRAWRSLPWRSRRRCAGGRSWSPRRRSGPARRTWSPPPASRTPTGCRCCSSAGDTFQQPRPRPGAPAGRALRRSRRRRSTTPSAQSRATGTGSPARRRWCRACRTPSRRCSTRPTAGPRSSGCPQDVQAEAYDYPARLLRAARARAAAPAPRPARARRGGGAPPRGASGR